MSGPSIRLQVQKKRQRVTARAVQYWTTFEGQVHELSFRGISAGSVRRHDGHSGSKAAHTGLGSGRPDCRHYRARESPATGARGVSGEATAEISAR